MLGISVNIKGDAEAMAKLAKVGESIEDFKEALEIIGEAMVHYFSHDVFDSHGAQFGPAWQQLSASTRAQKAKHFRAYTNVPLVATGKMQQSFEAEAEARKLTVTNTAPYFVYHQSSAPRVKIPRRQMMGIDTKMKALIKSTIEADIATKLAAL